METKLYKNSDAIRILGISQRSVINWTEKGLVEPVTQARGAGSKREYSYLNLLELALCKHLSDIGLGVYSIKCILVNLRKNGDLKRWAENFDEFYYAAAKSIKEDIDEVNKGPEDYRRLFYGEGLYDTRMPTTLEDIIDHIKPTEPVGILVWCYQEGQVFYVSPWDSKKTVEGRVLGDISSSDKVVIVNLGRIKKRIDEAINTL